MYVYPKNDYFFISRKPGWPPGRHPPTPSSGSQELLRKLAAWRQHMILHPLLAAFSSFSSINNSEAEHMRSSEVILHNACNNLFKKTQIWSFGQHPPSSSWSIQSLIGKMSTSFHSFSSHSSQNESRMRKWPKNDVFWPEWDWPHPSHSLSFISFRGHPKPRMTLEWEKTSFSSHFRGITKPNFPSSEKCFNFGTVGIKGQTNDTEWLENDKNESKMKWKTVEWYEWV